MLLKNGFLKVEFVNDYFFIEIDNNVKIYEFCEVGFENFKDFINNLIDAGFENFKIAMNESYLGIFNILAEVKNFEIISMLDDF